TLTFLLAITAFIYLFLAQSSLKKQVKQLQRRVRALNDRLNQQEYENHQASPDIRRDNITVVTDTEAVDKSPTASAPVPTQTSQKQAVTSHPQPTPVSPLGQQTPMRAPQPPVSRPPQRRPAVAKKPSVITTWLDNAMRTAKHWLTSGNVPVKIGVLVLLATVIAFLRFATQQGWLQMPIEVKLAGIATAAIAALGFAWKQRHHKRSFSLSIQGGSLGVLLLELFAAVKLYQLMPAAPAFALSVVVVAAAAWLAVRQDAKPLAIFAILAGFLAPIWLSDGSGSHVVLFSYYAILNAGIFYVATQKPWRELNLLGFVATYVIGAAWGGLRYHPADFATTLPFVLLFFAFYLLIPLYYQTLPQTGDSSANHRKTRRIDSALLFGTPLVTVALLAAMLYERSQVLAGWCFVLGLVYALLAFGLRMRAPASFATLQSAYWGLAAGLMTLAVPIGLSAKATGTIFALEGAGALWLGLRQQRRLTQFAGLALQGLSAVSFTLAYAAVNHFERAIINEYYLSTVLIAAAGGLSAWFVTQSNQREAADITTPRPSLMADGLFVWAMLWWLGGGLHEILRYAEATQYMPFSLIFLLASGAAAAYLWRYLRLITVAQTAALMLLLALGFALQRLTLVFGHPATAYPLSMLELLAWGAAAIFGALTLRWLRPAKLALTQIAVIAWLLALLTAATSMLARLLDGYPHSSGVYWLELSGLWLACAYTLWWRPQWLARCYPPHASRWLKHLRQIIAVVLLGFFIRVLAVAGGEGFYVPLLSVVDALQIALLIPLLAYIISTNQAAAPNQRQRRAVTSIGFY
ncbi:MAG: hypothetical protein CSA53_07510, partial [Gammaproteobacteria bacterium]